jgi:hypothetical protein
MNVSVVDNSVCVELVLMKIVTLLTINRSEFEVVLFQISYGLHDFKESKTVLNGQMNQFLHFLT